MLPQPDAAHPRSERHGTATLGWMACPVAATPETVQRIVTTLLPDGSPDIHTVAAMARLSVRTLQRRLHDQGMTFAWMVAGARLAMAQQMLVDPARKVIDVALDLGYSDPAHFTRAFVRWTGLAPREFRLLHSTGWDHDFRRPHVRECARTPPGRRAADRHHGGFPDVRCVDMVRLSPRTLQRRSCGAGLTFTQVVARSPRRRRAADAR